ncbi:transcriptional activator mut3p [Fusarium longipes]|uniref:Transcriptional activator mut3p n=1 Tax=Fusarium longipes TaxID=694270 RepID=A0A395SZ81_9HYPO|nr:transcriptional activator mut3p [Fusarium longipes]
MQSTTASAPANNLKHRFFQGHQYAQSYTLPSTTATDNGLPTHETIKDFVTNFVSSEQFLVFPVLSLQRFLYTTLPLAQVDTIVGIERQRGVISAKACVRAILVLGDVLGHNVTEVGPTELQNYVREIEDSLPVMLQEMTIDGLESLTMLIIYKYFVGDLRSASFLISFATRMIFQLGAHIPPPTAERYDKYKITHHMRDLFWVCYCMDKDLCHRIAKPPIINDAHCELSFPTNYAEMQNSNILSLGQLPNFRPTTVPLYPWDIRLSLIKSRIYEDLYSMSASIQPEAEVLRRIRYLDEDLEVWRLTLPLDHRPTLSFLDKTPVDEQTNTQAIMLRLSYHHSVILIHKARCRLIGPVPGLVDTGYEANFQLLVDASKSILTYLEKALPVVAHECFWYVNLPCLHIADFLHFQLLTVHRGLFSFIP